jgi:NTE family protein
MKTLGVGRLGIAGFSMVWWAIVLSGCATTRPWINPPQAADRSPGYVGVTEIQDPSRAPDVLVIASFSGGGSRAAALASAVVAELDATPLRIGGRTTTLAKEIDIVIGVSGGSVAASHMALYGVPDHLKRFRSDFLDVDLQSAVIRSALSPKMLYRGSSPWYGRGNILSAQLDTRLFHGKTFGDLHALTSRPFLVIGATDLSSGAAFDFTSQQFDAICSSIDDVPLSFAVAASSAVPVIFSPLTLKNHRVDCPKPGLLTPVVLSDADSARVRLLKSDVRSLALNDRRYLHLVDGGLSDNLGTRRVSDFMAQSGGIGAVLDTLRTPDSTISPTRSVRPRIVIFISVNSERAMPPSLDQRDTVPGTLDVLNTMINSELGRYSRETTLLFDDAVAQWRRELKSASASIPGEGSDIFSITVDLSALDDATLRSKVLAIPTAFRLSDADQQLLRLAARQALAQSPEFQRLLQSKDLFGSDTAQ